MESLIVLNYLHFFQYDTWNLQWLNYPFLFDVQAEELLYNHKVFCGIFKLTNKHNYHHKHKHLLQDDVKCCEIHEKLN